MNATAKLKEEILAALRHPEADEGLYFDNLITVHEEEERPVVTGDQLAVLEALNELSREGKITIDDSGERPIFRILS